MSSLFNIGVSGLMTARRQLATTGHNIANVNTAGYARQRVEQASLTPSFSGAGYTGNGVQSEATIREYDEFLEQQVRSSQSQLNRYEAFNELSGQVDNLLADSQTGLGPVLGDFFNAVQEANNHPTSTATRSVLLSEANVLSDRFQTLAGRFNELESQVNQRLSDLSGEINSRVKSIADLNQRIGEQQNSGNAPSDLLDKREQLIKELSERVEVSVQYQNNSANVFMGSGQALVQGKQSFALTLQEGEFANGDKELMLSGASGSTAIHSQIKGGELQGVLEFKDSVLQPAVNALGSIAAGVASEFNQQHALGTTLKQDTQGFYQLGGNFFSDLSGNPQNVLGSKNNQGNADLQFDLTDTSLITSSDYAMSFRSFGGTHTFSMTRLSDGAVFSGSGTTTGGALTALNNDLANTPPNVVNTGQGIQLNFNAGSVADGDNFLLQPTRHLAANMAVELQDPTEIALASPLIATSAVDSLGVNSNQGTGNITFNPFTASPGVNNSQTLNNLPVQDTLGASVDIVLTYNGTGFDIGSTASPAQSPYSPQAANPPVTNTPIAYSSTDSGKTFQLPGSDYGEVQFTITGDPAPGDRFVIANNRNPIDDNRNGLNLSEIQTKPSLLNGSADFQGGYALMTAGVGTLTQSAQVDVAAQTTINEQAQLARGALSGVSLDEEAANLLKFQQLYPAAAQVIVTADEVFDTLLNATDKKDA